MNATVLSPRLCALGKRRDIIWRTDVSKRDHSILLLHRRRVENDHLFFPLLLSFSLSVSISFSLSFSLYTNTYLSGNCIVYSSWQASRPFFPVTYPAQGIGPPAWYYKGSHDPIVSITFHRDIRACCCCRSVCTRAHRLTHDVREWMNACLSIKSACRLIS